MTPTLDELFEMTPGDRQVWLEKAADAVSCEYFTNDDLTASLNLWDGWYDYATVSTKLAT